jgi:hypothetical protein
MAMQTADAPIAAWLHLGPQSQASVCVTFLGTYRKFTLSRVQARQLHHALSEAAGLMASDAGDSEHRTSHKLKTEVEP